MGINNTIKKKFDILKYKCFKDLYFKNSTIGVDKARIILNEKWEKNDATCIRKHICETPYEYDLQVVIPAYNMEKYIEECVDSVVNQKTDYKYVVYIIDDGSKDGTLEILKKYNKYSNIKVISKSNGGVSTARNAGIDRIVANYIMFIDSDDYLAEGCIQALMEKAYETEADIVSGAHERLINGKKVLYTHYDCDKYVDDYSKIPGMPWGKVYKSELVSNVIYPEKYWFEDTIIRFMLIDRAKSIYYINKSVYVYRILESSASHSNSTNPKNIDSYWVSEIIVEDYAKAGYSMNDEILNSLLKQSVINAHRIRPLGRDVEEAAFVLTRSMIVNLFTEDILSNNKNVILDYFIHNNFGGYKLYCDAN